MIAMQYKCEHPRFHALKVPASLKQILNEFEQPGGLASRQGQQEALFHGSVGIVSLKESSTSAIEGLSLLPLA